MADTDTIRDISIADARTMDKLIDECDKQLPLTQLMEAFETGHGGLGLTSGETFKETADRVQNCGADRMAEVLRYAESRWYALGT